jgi:hypothetical protein
LRNSRFNILDGLVVSSGVVRGDLVGYAAQWALGTLPENGNVMPKHVGATIYNK